jgi:hypothetical protein
MSTEMPRKIGPTGHWGEYAWQPHPRGESRVYHQTSGEELMAQLTLRQAEQIARLLEEAYVAGHSDGWQNAKRALHRAINREFPT